MKKEIKKRTSYTDVFHSWLLNGAQLAGEYEFAVINEEHQVPRKIITFSEAMKEKNDFHQWVCFFECDYKIERFWNNPLRYIEHLSRFDGIISPDYSVYCNMPLNQQIWNMARGRMLGSWMQRQGLRVIPNVRFGDYRTFECCCDGISRYSIIAVGTLGCVKYNKYVAIFEEGLEYIVSKLLPEVLIIYGCAPRNLDKIKKMGVNVIIFSSNTFSFAKEVLD